MSVLLLDDPQPFSKGEVIIWCDEILLDNPYLFGEYEDRIIQRCIIEFEIQAILKA